MNYIHEEDVPGTPDRIVVKPAAWNPQGRHSTKYVWPDKNGNPSRGGEIPIEAIPQMVRFLAQHGELTRAERVRIITVLAASLWLDEGEESN